MNVFVVREIKDAFETVKDLEKIGVKSKSLPITKCNYKTIPNYKNKYDFIFKYMSKSVDEIFDTLLSLDYLTTSKLELYLACEKLISTVEFLNQAEMQVYFLLDEIYNSVSYTHLTLPTKVTV